MMEKHRVNVCRFCFSPSTKFYQSENCIEPPMQSRFDGTTELRNALKKIVTNDGPEKSMDVCVQCNGKFQRIYAFMGYCSKNVFAPTENAGLLKMIADDSSIGQSSRKEDHSEGIHAKFCEDTQVSKFKAIKRAIVRIKRLKMVTFAIKVTPECLAECNTVENDSAMNDCEANLKESRTAKCPEIEDIKSEILDDIHTEDYHVMETLNGSRNLVASFLPKKESISDANTSHSVLSPEQSSKKNHSVSNLKRSPNAEHRTSSNKRYKCGRCRKYFPSLFNLNKHQKIHSGKRFECGQCNGCFPTEQYLRLHVSKKHEKSEIREIRKSQFIGVGKRFKCDQCGKYFSCISNLRYHQESHAGIIFDCAYCDAKFRAGYYLQKHLRKMHKGLKEHYQCSQCEKAFSRLDSLRDHERLHTGNSVKCDQCGKNFGTKQMLQFHKYSRHANKQYKCDHCHKKFVEIDSLQKHILIHQNGSLKCDQCGKEYKQMTTLRQHKETHNSRTKYKCNQCEKAFIALTNLKDHQRVHTGQRVECNLCGANFRSMQTLYYHKSKEHKKGRYKCGKCEKYFSRISALRYHLESHTGIIFDCAYCDATFGASDYLRKHVRETHKDLKEQYKCNQCEKVFAHLDSLRDHLRIHTGGTFNCQQCDKRFIKRSKFLLHTAACNRHASKVTIQMRTMRKGYQQISMDSAAFECRKTAALADQSTCSKSTEFEDDLIEV